MSSPDVIVIGAGAAGLGAASALSSAGYETVVVEARARVGGRILTERIPGLAVPIELGAEFVHGEARSTRKLADEHALAIADVGGQTYIARRGRLAPMGDFRRRIDSVMRRLRSDRAADRSFADALDAMGRSISTGDRALARQFVEGFQAADVDDISERALTSSARAGDRTALRAARLVGGYQPLFDALVEAIRPRVRLGVIVTAVRWRRGRVVVESRDRSGAALAPIVARAAIITVPVGVLHARPGATGAIELDPPVRAVTNAASSMAMGPVVKFVLRMDDTFWVEQRFAKRSGRDGIGNATFVLSGPRTPFATVWTTYPIRSPVLVAWSGGGQTRALNGLSAEELEARAVESLAYVFSTKPAVVRGHLSGTFYHDWVNDPFSRGAYSYPRVGGYSAASRLAAPIERTLWFAGEATAGGAEAGTVEGAINSGLRAARAVARAVE